MQTHIHPLLVKYLSANISFVTVTRFGRGIGLIHLYLQTAYVIVECLVYKYACGSHSVSSPTFLSIRYVDNKEADKSSSKQECYSM